MRIRCSLLLIALCLMLPFTGNAQTMIGIVVDAASGHPMPYVSYENIFTHVSGITDSSGRINIQVAGGQMVEFHKLGYNTAHVRIPRGSLPPFFKVGMEVGAIQMDEVQVINSHRNFHNDSLRNHEIYKNEIEYQRMSGAQMIQHPFTAMSRHYQSIMRFQKEYAYLEEQRYIDYTFNDKTITNLTGLKGDSLQHYMRQYRPGYQQLRDMPAYTFFSYIKATVEQWRQRQRYGGSRVSGGY